MTSAFFESFLLTYAALFPIVNPFGSAPLYLSFTQFYSDAQRATLAGRVAVNSFALLLGSLFVGSYVLELFGISLPVVRIAGGLLVAAFGWRLVNSDSPSSADHAEATSTKMLPDAFYPLTMPLTVGPGSISVAITLGSQKPEGNVEHLILLGAAAVLGIAAITLTVFLCYRFAQRFTSALGPTGTNVVIRLSSFILLCIGIQIMWSGWSELRLMH
jgi:multiple antibiotic resistance protein